MNNTNNIILWVLCTFILTGCGGSSVQEDEHRNESKEDEHETFDNEILFTAEQAKAAGLEVWVVAPDTFRQVIKTGGQILSAQGDEVTIAATTNGLVSFTGSTVEGVVVRKGETIASISAENIANGDPAAQAKIVYETAEKEYQRAKDLVKDKIISARDFEQSRLRYETARTAYHAFAGKSGANGVRVTTPIGGYIKNRFVNEGEFVSVGQPIATISQNRRLQLRAEVPERYFNDLQHIGNANFKVSYSNKLYKLDDLKGRLLSFGKSTGQTSFYIPVTFEFDNIGTMIPGSYAEVYLLSRPRPNIITLPICAVIEEQGLYFAYLQLDEEGYVKKEITLGANDGERVQILSGIHVGDRIVTHGVYQLKLAAHAGVVPEGHTHNH